MPASRFEFGLRGHGDVAVIDLAGDIDAGASDALERAYDAAAPNGAAGVLLNFRDVEYINSTGIALVVGILARARKDGRSIFACGLADHYREIFEITRLSDFVQIFPDEASAVGGAAPGSQGGDR